MCEVSNVAHFDTVVQSMAGSQIYGCVQRVLAIGWIRIDLLDENAVH